MKDTKITNEVNFCLFGYYDLILYEEETSDEK